MIYEELTSWIADAESWQAHRDYRVSDLNLKEKPFFLRQSDFYISLLSELQDVLERFLSEEDENISDDLLMLAKGLEIFSLENKRTEFDGVSYSRNMLYVAALYYLADYPATSFLLLRQFSTEDYNGSLERFIYFFLSRTPNRVQSEANPYFRFVYKFLRSGDNGHLDNLLDLFLHILNHEATDSRHFVLAYFSKCLLRKFKEDNIWTDLIPYGEAAIWLPYVRFNLGKNLPIWSLFPSQKNALQKGLLEFERAFSLQTPTSSGKTSITELVIFNEIRRNPESRILYLAPFRALASELRLNLGRNLGYRLGISIKTIYGGNIITEWDRVRIEEATVLISTPEKFMALETNEPGILAAYDLIICDEGHLIDSRSRGISYELLLSRFKKNTARPKRFLFLSAIIPNIQQINTWLGGTREGVAVSNYRPTEIELALLRRNSPRNFDLIVNANRAAPKQYLVTGILNDSDFTNVGPKFNPTSKKVRAAAVALKALNSGAVAIFCSTKDMQKGVLGTASEVLNLLGYPLPKPIAFADEVSVLEITEYFEFVFGVTYILTRCARNGFLFHHGDIPQFIRELIELYTREGKFKLLICTNTLAEGVNLPIKTLVVQSTTRYDGNISLPIERRDLKNLIGRAGRAGKEIRGTIIVLEQADLDIMSEVVDNVGLEDANGFLFYALNIIDDYVVRSGAPLTNDLLDELRQSDIIDDAIMLLLSEEINPEQLVNDIKELTRNTFTYFQSEQSNRERLEEIFSLRAVKIREAIENGNIQRVRKTGIPLRLFNQYVARIAFDLPLVETLTDPADQDWLNFLFDNLERVNQIDKFLPEYTRGQLISFVTQWLDGALFPELAELIGQGVTEAMELLKSLEFTFQQVTNRIIRHIEDRRSNEELQTSIVVVEWTNYLTLGVRTELQTKIIDLGLNDRPVVHALSDWLVDHGFETNDRERIKQVCIQEIVGIIETLADDLPALALKNLQGFIGSLRVSNL